MTRIRALGSRMPDFGSLTFLWIILAVVVLHFVATVAAGACEKRPIQPYYVPALGEEYEPTPKAAQANAAAKELSFRHGALSHDGKGKLYRVRYDFWISPDDSILVIVGGGTVATVPMDGIEMYTRLADGSILCTTNHAGQADISGVLKQLTVPNADMHTLVARHTRRVSNQEVVPFPSDAPIAGYFDIRREIADGLERKGYSTYLDPERMVWRKTLKGALVFYFVAVWMRRFGWAVGKCE